MDDLTKAELDQLLAVFRDQSLQIIEEMGNDLLALESGPADPEAMTRLRGEPHLHASPTAAFHCPPDKG